MTFSSIQLDIPRTVNTIERSVLNSFLSGFRGYRVLLVTAPPGYGKTTAVAQFAEREQLPTAWHTIEERDRDLPNLQQHTLQALSTVIPGIRQREDEDLSPHECAEIIAGHIRDSATDHFLLVLDDLHLLSGAAQIELWLRALVELLPSKCHLVLISRTVPDLPLAELIAKRQIAAIGQSQLRFTDEEALALARNYGSAVSDDQIRQRVRHLEGWPAGLSMALQPLPNEIELQLARGQQGPEALFFMLAELMLQKQPPVLRDFLLASSVLPRLTPELCSRILSFANSDDALEWTSSRGLFVTQVAGGYVYHRLFRQFLQDTLKHTNPGRYIELHAKAGNWFRDNGDIEAAFEHYVAANMIPQALALAEHMHMAYFSQGKVETLLHWRSMLGSHAERIPYLLYKCAIIYTDRYLYAEAEAELAVTQRAFERSGDVFGLADVELLHMLILRRRGEHHEIIERASALLARAELPDRITTRAKHYLALSHLALGDIETAITLLEAMLPFYHHQQDLYTLSLVLQDLEVAYSKQGDLDSASRCLQQVVSIRRQLRRPDALALALNNLGYHYHQRHNYKEALRTIEEGLRVVVQTSNRRAESYLLWTMGDISRDLGDYETAQRHYDRAYELSGGMETSLQRSITLSMSVLYRWQGEHALAERLARETLAYYPPAEDNAKTPDGLLAQAKMWIAHAYHVDVRAALLQLDKTLCALKPHNITEEFRLTALYCALAAQRAGITKVAEAYLNQALTGSPTGENTLSPEMLAEIANASELRGYIESNAVYRDVKRAIDKLKASQSHLPAIRSTPKTTAKPDLTYSLRVFTLGAEVIERNGQVVPVSAWRASRAREFFLYLLLEGAQTRDAISLAFWPDSTIKRVRSNFHTTLYRARQALGENVVVFDDELYKVNPEIEIACDALELDDCVRQARMLQPIDARADDLYQRAVTLYRGDFLTSIDSAWVDEYRRHLYETYVEALLGSGHCARARGDFRTAISTYRYALQQEPYRESIHRALFLCYADLGEPYQVLTHFREMQSLFQAELGINPSPETIQLVQTLT